MNKYLGILIAMSTVLAAAAAVSAGEEVESFTIGETTYYVDEGGLYEESNECDGLQTAASTVCQSGDMAGESVDRDARVSLM